MSVVINGSAGVTTNSGAVYNGIASGTAVASTSGTSIDFTSIPSWVKRITVMLTGVSTNGTSAIQIQIGSGSVSTTGYVTRSTWFSTTSTSTTGMVLTSQIAAASNTQQGMAVLSLLTNNTWVYLGNVNNVGNDILQSSGGSSPSLSGALDRVRITTVNGTDTFDAGSINILYE